MQITNKYLMDHIDCRCWIIAFFASRWCFRITRKFLHIPKKILSNIVECNLFYIIQRFSKYHEKTSDPVEGYRSINKFYMIFWSKFSLFSRTHLWLLRDDYPHFSNLWDEPFWISKITNFKIIFIPIIFNNHKYKKNVHNNNNLVLCIKCKSYNK